MRVPLTSVEKRVVQTYTPEEAKRIITHKPQSRTGKRTMALLYLLIDTGARVSEALSLTRKNLDFDNLLVTLRGKGNKQRRAPISLECRKRLYHWLASHDHDLVFCAEGGGKLRYDNVRRDFLVILRAVKVEKTEGSFHAFRVKRKAGRGFEVESRTCYKGRRIRFLPRRTAPTGVLNMWFRVFIVLRFPASVICLFGYSAALGVQFVPFGGPDLSFLIVALSFGAFIFPVVASLKLVRGRESALWLAWWLLALETVGAVLLGYAMAYLNAQAFELLTALAVVCATVMGWTLPNVAILYKARSLFTEPAKEKPGL
jgi:hypothetical protein